MRPVHVLTIYGLEPQPCVARRNGLAITRSLIHPRRWTLTHIKSGRRLGPLCDLRLSEARVALGIAASLGDWGSVDFGEVPHGVHDFVHMLRDMVRGI
jgi:hypothetical protein